MSSCMAPVPSAFSLGGVCGGHGICVNSIQGMLLCKCDPWFSGASDFFDNRVEQMPDGTWLSYSCQSSQVGTYVVWSFWILCGLIRVIQLVPLWIQFYRRHFADPKKVAEGVLKDAPLRIVSIDLFAMTIPFFITGICKLAGMTLGTNILPTITLCLTVFFAQLAIFDLSTVEFEIFVKGSSSPEKATKAKKFRLFLKFCAFGVFFSFVIAPSLSALGMDKTLGPLENNESVVIYFRNFGSIAYVLLDMWTTWMVRARVKMIMSHTKNDNSATAALILKMDKELKAYFIFLASGGIVYLVFVIPELLQLQTYSVGIMLSLGALRHSAKAFNNDKDLRKRGITGANETIRRIDVTGSMHVASSGTGGLTLVLDKDMSSGGVAKGTRIPSPSRSSQSSFAEGSKIDSLHQDIPTKSCDNSKCADENVATKSRDECLESQTSGNENISTKPTENSP